MSILRRLGNKQAIAHKIIPYFPPHKIFISPFFGAGGMFFNKPKAKYNIVNDLDSDVYNLFQVVMNNKEELEKAFYMMPIHSDLLKYWKVNKETEPIKKALRFLFLSNFTYLGGGDIVRFGAAGSAQKDNLDFSLRLQHTYTQLESTIFNNIDFEKFLKDISFRTDGRNDEAKTFIYCDPPYINTNDNYSNSFTKADFIRLLDANEATGCKFAISEFDNPFVIQQAKERGLNVHIIGERQNLENRRTEILITNYQIEKTLFD